MDLINKAIKFLYELMPRQTTQIDVMAKELDTLIKGTLDIKVDYEREDASYMLVNLEFLEKFVGASYVPEMKYEKEVFDCDGFSVVMKANFTMLRQGHALGRVKVDRKPGESGGVHSLNLFVGEDSVVYLLEPQTGKYFLPPEDWEYHKVII
jgi:hypothetical protein